MANLENNPFSSSHSAESGEATDTKETKDGKKKSSKEKRLGAFLVKPESEESPKLDAEKEGLLKNLFSKNEESQTLTDEAGSTGERSAAEKHEGNPEDLDPQEAAYVEQELARAEAAQLVTSGHEASADDAYAQDKVEEFYERIANEDKSSEEALSEVLDEIEQDNPEITEASNDVEKPIETVDEPAENVEDAAALEATGHQDPAASESLPGEGSEADPDDETGQPTAGAATPGAGSGAGPAAAGAGGAAATGGGGGAGGRPPAPPSPGGGNLPPHGPYFGGPLNPNFGPIPLANPNVLPQTPTTRIEYRTDPGQVVGAALIGGIVGYLIGRRRGRIKTEKRLLPVQKKLEKQVTNLQDQLKFKEEQVRKAARAKARLQPLLVEQAVQRRITTHTAEAQKQVLLQESAIVETGRRVAAPEAAVIHLNPPAPERIGKVLVTAEAGNQPVKAQKTVERQPAKPVKESLPVVEKHVETMSRAELLAVSDKIIIDGSSLRQIYETHLVGERGLRRLVSEHLRGGNLKKALRREIVEREIDFERDPVMRDLQPGSGGISGSGTAVTPQLQALVQKAAAALPSDNDNEVAFLKARAKYQEEERVRQRQRQQLMDVSLSGTILLLVVIIVWLLLTYR